MADSLCKDGNYWSVAGNGYGKRPSRLWDRRRGRWRTRSDLHWRQYLVCLIKTQTVCAYTLGKHRDYCHTRHTVVGMIPARPLQGIWEGDVLLTGPDPFQFGRGEQVPFAEALFEVTRCSWRPYSKMETEYKSTNNKTPKTEARKVLIAPWWLFVEYRIDPVWLTVSIQSLWTERGSN